MKRKNKNILMLLLLIILLLTSFISISYVRKNSINSSSFNKKINENFNMEEPPEKPDGSMINPKDGLMKEENNSSNMPSSFYVLFGIQCLGISLIIMYLIMSRFNKKTLKETFSSFDKITIYILSIIVLSILLIFTERYIVNNMSNTSSNNGMLQNNMVKNNSNISYSGAKEIT